MNLLTKKLVGKINPQIKRKIFNLAMAGIVATVVFTSCVDRLNNNSHVHEQTELSQNEKQNNSVERDCESLNFGCMTYGDENYLTLNKEDMAYLIKQALKVCEKEYLNYGATPRFSNLSSNFSEIDENFIMSIWEKETSLRIVKLKIKDDLYNVDNYDIFYGVDDKGTIYYGVGMISKIAIEDLVERDRKAVYKMNCAEYFTVNNKKLMLNFENSNPYLYLKSTGAKTELEIKLALAENLQFNAQCCFAMLNRAVADGVKEGAHDNELKVLNSYRELSSYSQVERQLWFAALSYNEGFKDVYEMTKTGKLFDKDDKGKYILNIDYAFSVMRLYKQNLESNQVENVEYCND